MRRKIWVLLAMLLVLPAFMMTTACSKKAAVKKEAAGMSDEEKARLEAERQKELERQRLLEEERLRKEAAAAAQAKFEGEHVYYAFDSATLDAAAQDTLRRKAQYLRTAAGVSVTVEGHCDERGTVEYNLALGDRRAEAAKKFLADMGIEASRMTTVSYGEERPADMGHTEDAWEKNRRAQFVVK